MTKKIINSIIIIIIMVMSINFYSYEIYGGFSDIFKDISDSVKDAASDTKKDASKSTTIDPKDYKPDSTDNSKNADKLKDIGNSIIGFLQIVGSILSVTVLIILGIKYMVGSADERAEYKKTMIPYLIGAIMIFAITNILGIISTISGGLVT